MKTAPTASKRRSVLLAVAGLCASLGTTAYAGDVFLTGHDVLLHGGQNGFDAVILDYLRGATPKASYNIGIVGTANTGFASFTGGVDVTGNHATVVPTTGSTLSGYASPIFYDAEALAADPNRATILAGLDLLIVESHVNCGGCSLTTAGSNALNSMAADIATAFNAGMDIFGQASSDIATYYNFLPPGAVATGMSISGSSGFVATADGLAIGIANNMINGFPTHNRFTSQAAAFTVFETRPTTGGASEIISIGLRDGVITTGGITTGGTTVPDSGGSVFLLALALPALAYLRRKTQ